MEATSGHIKATSGLFMTSNREWQGTSMEGSRRCLRTTPCHPKIKLPDASRNSEQFPNPKPAMEGRGRPVVSELADYKGFWNKGEKCDCT